MSRKRRNTSSPEPGDHPSKRRSVSVEYDSDDSDYPDAKQRPQIDASTGQSGAFPGLRDDGERFYGPAADGIDYLRMVRSERQDIPELLTTIQPPTQDEEDGGYWYDGAYTAQPAVQSEREEAFGQAQLLYYESLQQHFRLVRATMNCIPPLAEVEALGSTRPISFPPEQRAAKDTWDRQILREIPHPVQVACMDASSVFEVIKHITKRMGNFLRHADQAIMRLGAWVWALLGKCPERGELGSEEISDLRSFAQRMIEVTDLMEVKGSAGQEDLEGDDDEANPSDGTHDIRSAGVLEVRTAQTDLDRHEDPTVLEKDETLQLNNDMNMIEKRRMLVEMVLTVVGEVYGQRDLLELRKPWHIAAID